MENWREFLTEQDVSPVTKKAYPPGVRPEQYDEISAIIDNQVENRFINWLVKSMEGQDDSTPLQKLNMDRLLQKFLMHQFNHRTIKSPELKE